MPTTTINLTGQALSKVDDTNVTLTLGGTPLTALLKATSLTLGWSGQLSVARGGTGLSALGTASQLIRVNGAGTALEYFTPTYGSGTVTTVSVVSANGFAGTVANAGTTPAITLSTSITGLLKGNGTAISAASAGTDYEVPLTFSTGLTRTTNTITIDTAWAGQTAITTLGTIATGVWQGTAIGKAYGGTGVNIGTTALSLGTASTTAGQLTLQNTTNAFTQTIRGTNPAASIIYDLPTTAPTAGQVLSSTAPSAGVATLSWATASSGITIGGTSITSGTDNRILFQDATASDFVTQTANFTMGAVASGYLDVPTGYALAGHVLIKEVNTTSIVIGNTSAPSMTGAGNTVFGYQNGIITNGTNNTYIGATATTRSNNNGASYNTTLGYGIDINSTTGYNVVIGALSGVAVTGYYNVIMGVVAGTSGLSGTGNIILGCYSGELSTAATSSNILIGANSFSTTSNTVVIGGANAHGVDGTINTVYFNNPTSISPTSVTLNASGGIGSNISGAILTIAAGKSTGTGSAATLRFQTSTVLASGTSVQTLVNRLIISQGAVTTDASTATWADALDFVLGSTTGTKFGTATTQKLAFWNATPIVQPTTAVGSATFISAGAGTNIKTDDTFDGYTLQQVVKALRNLGLLT